jgi:hypothetical protein
MEEREYEAPPPEVAAPKKDPPKALATKKDKKAENKAAKKAEKKATAEAEAEEEIAEGEGGELALAEEEGGENDPESENMQSVNLKFQCPPAGVYNLTVSYIQLQ